MTVTTEHSPTRDPDRQDGFDSLDPTTGQVLGSYPIHGPADVIDAVDRARAGAEFWSSLTFAERSRRLTRWAGVLSRRLAQLAEAINAETGKPNSDAQLEVVLGIENTVWAAGNAAKVLGSKRVSAGLGWNQAATVEYQPFGVVGVIGPWNYPVFTPLGSIAYALAAGNAVVYKPSEFAPGVGHWLVDAFAQVVPEAPVLQLVTGLGETGKALCRAGVDKIAFSGSARTGRQVLHACADGLIPAVIEAGGKDALLVDADADVGAAAEAAVWGGMSNAGQTCIGIERVYVHQRVYDAFLDLVTTQARGLRSGPGEQIGPMTMPSQPAVIRRHIADALAHGGAALIGGLDAVGDRFVQPTVLIDVPEVCSAVAEETFGPTLTIAKVTDMDEAVRLANASSYGLGASVFSGARGMELARRLQAGMVSVNSVIAFAGIPALPFGGVKQSGFGRVHGADGLREFAQPKSIARQRFAGPLKLSTFARTGAADKALATITALRRNGPGTLPPRGSWWSRKPGAD